MANIRSVARDVYFPEAGDSVVFHNGKFTLITGCDIIKNRVMFTEIEDLFQWLKLEDFLEKYYYSEEQQSWRPQKIIRE